MIDVASIVVAVVGLLGGLAAAAFTGWFALYSERRKRLIDAQKLVDKYSDPILLASQDLQQRLRNIILTEPESQSTQTYRWFSPSTHSGNRPSQYPRERPAQSGLAFHPLNPESSQKQAENENLLLYTAFLVGQYFSWTFILRRQAQFLKFSTDHKNRKLAETFQKIIVAFSLDDDPNDPLSPLSKPFSLWLSQQSAIGELMTTDYGDEPVCIGYATFYRNWAEDKNPNLGGNPPMQQGGVDPFQRVWGGVGYPPGTGGYRVDETNENAQMIDMAAYEYCSRPFRQFFRPIIEGIIKVETAKIGKERVPDQRLRHLQHLFMDLINVLDDKYVRIEEKSRKYCHRADRCLCEKCSGKDTCPCSTCFAPTNQEVKKQQV